MASINLKDSIKFSVAFGYSMYMNMSKINKRKVVLYYHELKKEHIPGFRRQVKFIADTFKVVKPSQILSTEPGEDENLVAITIDDAFESVYQNALPILKEYDLPAAIFAPVNRLGEPAGWHQTNNSQADKFNVMTHEQLIDIDKQGFEIFSHTCTHPMLTEIDDESLKHEVKESKRILEQLLEHEVEAISYPYGDYNLKVCAAAKQAGYKLGFTVFPSMVNQNTDPMMIGRFRVDPDESPAIFKLKCRGAFHGLISLYAIRSIIFRSFSL